MIDRLSAKWTRDDFTVFSTAVNRIEGLAIGPDHAGLFETTLLAALWPDLVRLDRLPSLASAPLPQNEDNFGESRHDANILFGTFSGRQDTSPYKL